MIKTWEDFEEGQRNLRDPYHSAEVPKRPQKTVRVLKVSLGIIAYL